MKYKIINNEMIAYDIDVYKDWGSDDVYVYESDKTYHYEIFENFTYVGEDYTHKIEFNNIDDVLEYHLKERRI